jgi:tRNA guanosine-2'-O-methyltransferase
MCADSAGTRGGGRSDIIVVASLIDKAPNLGGLARSCEIFQAAKLVVSDLRVATDSEFQGVSMTAERWLPMEAVPAHELPKWLEVRCLAALLCRYAHFWGFADTLCALLWRRAQNPDPGATMVMQVQAARQSGYALIGVEQTSESVSLPTFEFPQKTVLVLGAELEGISAELLSVLDSCVEIPQFGLLRSLNVHVSGALAVYEYARQRVRASAEAG